MPGDVTIIIIYHITSEPGGSDAKESACNTGDLDSVPELGRSPEEENGYLLQNPCLENSMDREAWWARSIGSQRVGHD